MIKASKRHVYSVITLYTLLLFFDVFWIIARRGEAGVKYDRKALSTGKECIECRCR